MKDKIRQLFDQQLDSWELARKNYAALADVKTKEWKINGMNYKVQFNPARILSSAAKVDSHSIQQRKCFLCTAHLPTEQKGIPFGGEYIILVNPYPIFPNHLTIPTKDHVAQRIEKRFESMLDLAETAEDYILFYNGPKCGASAPDHAHFQAGNKGFLPIQQEWEILKEDVIVSHGKAKLWLLNDAPRNTLVIESSCKQDAIELFYRIYHALDKKPNEEEAMINVLAWFEKAKKETIETEQYVVCLFPRRQHRPSCYAAEGAENILISPASVDMGGVFITPRESDFNKITDNDIANILTEVCLQEEAIQKLIKHIKN